MTKSELRQKAINFYNDVKSGKVDGFKIVITKYIKVGSITFIVEE